MTQIRAKQTAVETDAESVSISDRAEPQVSKTPSWFTQMPTESSSSRRQTEGVSTAPPYVETPGAEAYDVYRKQMEQRFREGQDLHDRPKANFIPLSTTGPRQRRPTLPLHEIQGRKKLYNLEQQSHKVAAGKPHGSTVPWVKMLGLGSIAICIGAVAGFGFSNSELVKQKYASLLGAAQEKIAALPITVHSEAPKPTLVANQSVIVKKPIATATLEVSDVRGTLGGMIPLALNAQSADASEPISLKITGLPEQAYLTAGVKSLEGNWTLKPAELAEVNLVVPSSSSQQFNLEVSAVDDLTGALAAPTKAVNVQLQNALPRAAEIPLTKASDGKVNSEIAASAVPEAVAPAAIVSPVSAVPETAIEQSNEPSPIPKALNEAEVLVAKGNALLETGDIIAARQFFTQAAELGNAQGSFGVARSYDSKVFAKLNVVGLQPDDRMAADWYKKAADGGVVASTQ